MSAPQGCWRLILTSEVCFQLSGVRTVPMQSAGDPARSRPKLTQAISAAMVELYAAFYDHDRTTTMTYLNDNIVVRVLENILTSDEATLVADGAQGEVIDGRVACQSDTEDAFTAAIPRMIHRRVVAFMSANQTTPGVACELRFLDAAPLAVRITASA